MSAAWIRRAADRAEERSRGRLPDLSVTEPKPPHAPASGATVTIPIEDYQRLVEATEWDDMITRCDKCGAWLDQDDPTYTAGDDWTGCLWSLTYLDTDKPSCRSYRTTK